jgi:hypothetical protein
MVTNGPSRPRQLDSCANTGDEARISHLETTVLSKLTARCRGPVHESAPPI